jgi:hypothetical protein
MEVWMLSKKMQERKRELEAVVHPSTGSLIKAAALRWTVENLGQLWPEVESYGQLLEMHMDGTTGDYDLQAEMESSLKEEHGHWKDEAAKFAAIVASKKLPLTLESMEQAFHGRLI